MRFVIILSRSLFTSLLLAFSAPFLMAEEHHDDFEAGQITCRSFCDRQKVDVKIHERNLTLAYAGQAAERFQLQTAHFDQPVQIEIPIPPARILDELLINISVFSNRPGWQLAARVVLPHQKDAATGQPLTRIIRGDKLDKQNGWQTLTCQTSQSLMSQQLILWRAALKPEELDAREMFIDRLYLEHQLGKGLTELLIDELRMSPIVAPDAVHLQQMVPVAAEETTPEISFQLDQLLVSGRPFFPVMVPYQKEPIESFRQLGVNVVWIDNYQDRALIDQFNRQGLWTTAWPPAAKSARGELLQASQAQMASIGNEADGILFWNLGVRIEPDAHASLQQWVQQIKSSDRTRRRPILADVTGSEKKFSRDLELLGVSKHMLQTSYSFRDYSAHLRERKLQAQPGTFLMTWLQTEPSQAIMQSRSVAGANPAVVEPEQIRLQTYLALCAGYKGLGYWNWTPLNATGVGFAERRAVIEQLNQELELLAPFVASGEVIHRFEVPLQSSAEGGTTSRSQAENASNRAVRTGNSLNAQAAVIRSPHGLMILLAGTDEESQYVPGPMGFSDVKLMIRGLPESAFLWEVTPTGLWPLETKRVTGGTEIRLPRFNMTAALMVATDQGVAQEMERKTQRIQQRSTELALEIARLKMDRVQAVDQELYLLGVGLPEASQIMGQSRRTLTLAEEAFAKQQYHQARVNADLSLQLMRILQRMYWRQAVRNLSAPTSLPHTVCFQTLPSYWRLVQQLALPDQTEVMALKTGQFEDPDAMLIEGWTKDVTNDPRVVVYDALDPETAKQGEYCLRIASVPAEGEQPAVIEKPLVTYQTPKISVKPGDLLHVSGAVRVSRPISASIDGFRIYDSQYGLSSALRWQETSGWESFEMMRPIWKQEELSLILELNGFGDVSIDDLQVKIIRLPAVENMAAATIDEEDSADETQKSRSTPLEFLNRFIR